jgi:hypothetical protein
MGVEAIFLIASNISWSAPLRVIRFSASGTSWGYTGLVDDSHTFPR